MKLIGLRLTSWETTERMKQTSWDATERMKQTSWDATDTHEVDTLERN